MYFPSCRMRPPACWQRSGRAQPHAAGARLLPLRRSIATRTRICRRQKPVQGDPANCAAERRSGKNCRRDRSRSATISARPRALFRTSLQIARRQGETDFSRHPISSIWAWWLSAKSILTSRWIGRMPHRSRPRNSCQSYRGESARQSGLGLLQDGRLREVPRLFCEGLAEIAGTWRGDRRGRVVEQSGLAYFQDGAVPCRRE